MIPSAIPPPGYLCTLGILSSARLQLHIDSIAFVFGTLECRIRFLLVGTAMSFIQVSYTYYGNWRDRMLIKK